MTKAILVVLALLSLGSQSTDPIYSRQIGMTFSSRGDVYADLYKKVRPSLFTVLFQVGSNPDHQKIGSAFEVNGVIVTARHVVSEETMDDDGDPTTPEARVTYYIKDSKGREYKVKKINLSKETDLAKLTVNCKEPSLNLAKANPEIGSEVIAIGNPMEFEGYFSRGSVGAYAVENYSLGPLPVLVFTAPIAPGSSGGLLVNIKGEVIGCTVGANVEWLGFYYAIPATDIAKFLLKP